MTVLRTMMLLALAAGAVSTATAAAPGTVRGKQYERCMGKAVSNVDMQECMSAQYALEDKRLNVAYRALMARQQGAREKELQEVQRLWLKYTEANCGFHDDPDGGTAARLAAHECAVSARAARAAELEELARVR
ncbi:lysozyme inhibitor LprI family protein [Massilia pseudoviolaceinigra]|uniref:lysozyme inhibitor LprI family protein n=1 Tax=Massilia pseudoviolaceinigra TaxID=3057165 RepID=UPI0027965F14|nr:lysozyme inhibitor LprI family protein [Massilia sp. CCM 9206]MDQ1924723.1 lysozyme inhibitor LprI family protein [Massilia sp. CCM 9206]